MYAGRENTTFPAPIASNPVVESAYLGVVCREVACFFEERELGAE